MHSTSGAGHALEAGWFLLKYAKAQGAAELQNVAVQKFMEVPFFTGWDKEHGGLFYFLDVDGHCPTQVQMTNNFIQRFCSNAKQHVPLLYVTVSFSLASSLLAVFFSVSYFTFPVGCECECWFISVYAL